MKFVNPLALFFFAWFAAALPVVISPLDTITDLSELFEREVPQEVEHSWALLERSIAAGNTDEWIMQKRDIAVLTSLMTSMNRTGSGVTLLNGFCTNPVTQPSTLNLITSFLKTQDLGAVLTAANKSGLAIDMVMMVFTHMEAFKGLVQLVKALFTSGAISLKRDLSYVEKRGFFSTITDFIGGIFGRPSSSNSTPAPSPTQQQQQQQTSSKQGQVTNAPQPTGDAPKGTGAGLTNKVTSATISVASGISLDAVNTASVKQEADKLAGEAAVDTNKPLPSAAATSFPTTGSSDSSNAAAKALNDFQAVAPKEASHGLLGGIIGGIVGTISNITKGLFNILNNTEAALFTAFLNAINLAGSMQSICESLQKSGLGVSVAHNLMTDGDMRSFAVKLVKKASAEGALTAARLFGALSSSGLITSIISAVLTNDKYRGITFSFFVQVILNFGSIFLS
ncbi:hypothetical protein DICA2_F28854 [Diutina catenulata]